MTGSLLQVIAQAMAGDGMCCQIFSEDGSCCMTDRAKEVLDEIALNGGPTLMDMEAFRQCRETVAVDREKYETLVEGFWTFRNLIRSAHIARDSSQDALTSQMYAALDRYYEVPQIIPPKASA